MSDRSTGTGADRRLGFRVVHRRYIDFGRAHYAGNLVDGGFILGTFSDIATDVCIHLDGDEGLFAGYSGVSFHAPLQAGDVLEVSAEVTRVGSRSRTLRLEARVLARSAPARGDSSAEVLATPLRVASAEGTVVVPPPGSGS